MSLDGSDQYYYGPDNFRILETTRRKRCRSCGVLIDIGSRCLEFTRARGPRNDIEENIYPEEVPLASQYLCEQCGEIYFNLTDAGC